MLSRENESRFHYLCYDAKKLKNEVKNVDPCFRRRWNAISHQIPSRPGQLLCSSNKAKVNQTFSKLAFLGGWRIGNCFFYLSMTSEEGGDEPVLSNPYPCVWGIFSISVVSIDLYLYSFMPFSYNGVYFRQHKKKLSLTPKLAFCLVI